MIITINGTLLKFEWKRENSKKKIVEEKNNTLNISPDLVKWIMIVATTFFLLLMPGVVIGYETTWMAMWSLLIGFLFCLFIMWRIVRSIILFVKKILAFRIVVYKEERKDD